jgi:hypothetical protein
MKKSILAALVMMAPLAFAYQLPNTTIKNDLEDVQLTEMYWSDKICTIQGVRPGMFWRKGQTIQLTGSCPDNEVVKIEFTTLMPPRFQIVGFAINKSEAHLYAYNRIYKIEPAHDGSIYAVLGE